MGGDESLGITTGQPNLCKQDLSKLDINKLTPLSPEVISRQATINIGTIGHVAHGKSTIVKAISGVQTVRFKNELERNITIKLEQQSEGSSDYEMDEDCDGDVTPTSSELSQDSFNVANADDFAMRLVNGSELTAKQKEDLRVMEKKDLAVALLMSQNGIMKEVRVKLVDIMKTTSRYKFKRPSSKQPISLPPQKKPKKWAKDFYEVEKILDKQLFQNEVKFLIKWKGWSEKNTTWEPIENLANCLDLVTEYECQERINQFLAETEFVAQKAQLVEHMTAKEPGGKLLAPPKVDMKALKKLIAKYLSCDKTERPEKLRNKIENSILDVEYRRVREEQLMGLKDWEDEMNSISKGRPIIRVENDIDLEHPPRNFIYIDDYLPGKGVVIPDEPPIGCDCEACLVQGSETTTCCYTNGFNKHPPYTTKGKVRVPPGTPIYECNKSCKCPRSCRNRIVQRGTFAKLCVFRTYNNTGWGVKTLRKIAKGSFVSQYVGEVITNEEAEKRGKEYDAAGRTYLFDLDYNHCNPDFNAEKQEQCPYTVDAAQCGNISHFINHSCDPNLAVYNVWINCLDPNLPSLGLFATRDIEVDEEITFDYMSGQEDKDEANKNDRQRLLLSEDDDSKGGETQVTRTRCKCGTAACRQYLF